MHFALQLQMPFDLHCLLAHIEKAKSAVQKKKLFL
jgi:hypothetical protein